MGDFTRRLKHDLGQIQAYLHMGAPLSISSDEKERLVGDSLELMRRIDDLSESFLTVGLLGGTGVGKSTIMNALAGSEISSTSHRRPHTDHVIIYRHRSAESSPDMMNALILSHEIVHDADEISQIVLCDLPDFDSLVGEHQLKVLTFLEHLDVLVWVVSPEKYADKRFYDFLNKVPKASQNFYFVLNKADIFFEGKSIGAGYEELGKAIARFEEHLHENAMADPSIYAVSALEAGEGGKTSAWNQFGAFRSRIFQHRDVKEIHSIKAANLDVEVDRFMSSLRKELGGLQVVRKALADFIGDFEGEKELWVEAARDSFAVYLEERFRNYDVWMLSDPHSLVGPGYAFGVAAREWKGWWRGRGADGSGEGAGAGRDAAASLRSRFDRIRDRMAHQMLVQGLPSAVVQRLETLLDTDAEWEKAADRLQRFFELRVATYRPRPAFGFKLAQYVIYLVLFACFILALAGGQDAWRQLRDQPLWSGLLDTAGGAVTRIFTPGGLAALASYLILQVYVGFRFFAFHKKSLQRKMQKFIESLRFELVKVWEEELDLLANRMTEFDRELEKQSAALSALCEARLKE